MHNSWNDFLLPPLAFSLAYRHWPPSPIVRPSQPIQTFSRIPPKESFCPDSPFSFPPFCSPFDGPVASPFWFPSTDSVIAEQMKHVPPSAGSLSACYRKRACQDGLSIVYEESWTSFISIRQLKGFFIVATGTARLCLLKYLGSARLY